MIKFLVFSTLAVTGIAVVQWYNRRPGPFRLLAAGALRGIACWLWVRDIRVQAAYLWRERWTEYVDRARRMVP